MIAALLLAAPVPLAFLAAAFTAARLPGARVPPPWPRLALCAAGLYATAFAERAGFIPAWLMWVLWAVLTYAYHLGRDDRGGPRRRGRARAALKRAREWLATGGPARRATA